MSSDARIVGVISFIAMRNSKNIVIKVFGVHPHVKNAEQTWLENVVSTAIQVGAKANH